MASFLSWIGLYNLLGSVLLMAMYYDPVADFVLRKGTEVVSEPYRHEGYARMWLWWAAITNVFMGVVMWRAAGWPVDVQREVTLYAVAVYFLGWLAVVFKMKSPRYARGRWALHPLWLGQMAWGLWGYWESLA